MSYTRGLYTQKEYSGKKAVSDGSAQIATDPRTTGSGEFWYVDSGASVILTGVCYFTGEVWYDQTTLNNRWIVADEHWTLQNAPSVSYSAAQAQNFVDKIIANNKQIVENNLFCARYADKLTASERQTLYALQTNLQERNDALADVGYCSNVGKSYPKGFYSLQAYLANFMAKPNIGVVITTGMIIVTAVVIAAVSTAAYFWYRYYFEQSEKDIKYSASLTKTLMAKLTPSEYAQLKSETQGIVTKAVLNQKLQSYGGIGKTFLLVALGAVGIVYVPKLLDKWRKK